MTTDQSPTEFIRFLRLFADNPRAPFPVHVLPSSVRRLIEEAAEALPCPPEFVAVPLLVFAGAAIGRSRGLRLKEGWTETPVLFAAIVGEPGVAKKTPSLKVAQHALDVLQGEAMARYDAARTTLTTSTDPVAPPDHTYTTDATLEAVAAMARDSAGFVVIRDELVAWVKSCDAYRGGRGGDRQSWLSLWSGTALKVDRKSAPPLYVPNPRVSVFGGVQPDMLSELASEGMRHDGFLDRILWAWPDPVRDRWTDANVTEIAKDAVLSIFRSLRSSPDTITVRLSPEAGSLYAEWYNDNAERTETAGGTLTGVYAKMTAQAARLALILHCLANPNDPTADTLSVETLRDALTLTEYFRSQAHRVMAHLNSSTSTVRNDLRSRVLRILQDAASGWVSKSAIHSALGGHTSATELDSALVRLQDMGQAEPRSLALRVAGRPSEAWRAVDALRINEINEETPEADDELAA